MGHRFAPEDVHTRLLAAAPLELGFDKHERGDLGTWRAALDLRLRALVEITPDPVDLGVRVEEESDRDGFVERRFVFTAEPGADVPCHLLLPLDRSAPHPVVICLQGHTSGMHLSLGRARTEADESMLAGGRDFGLQAVREGYGALVLEQRCFGERADARPPVRHWMTDGCHHASLTALLLGRTMMGERCLDVSRAIDALATFDDVDHARIACMGNSGGGATTVFAACLDGRIAVAMPSCYVCSFRQSIASVDHCADNYVPGLLRYVEMGDLAGLLAPRPLVVVAGREDHLFPLAGVADAYARIERIYDRSGAGDRCRLVIGEGGHRFYPDEAWPVFGELSGW